MFGFLFVFCGPFGSGLSGCVSRVCMVLCCFVVVVGVDVCWV